MKSALRLFLLLLIVASLQAGIPETWLADKAQIGAANRNTLYERFPAGHYAIATLSEHFAKAFAQTPETRTIHVGEAYFIDHCLNHHPEVSDEIYRRLQEILDAPDEVIIDRRDGKDGLVFAKTLDGTTYALCLRHYPNGQLVYKTLFPVGKKLYPRLPRFPLK